MVQIKPKGKQLDIVSIASDIAADITAIGSIATGITSDPSATAILDLDYLRRDGTGAMTADFNMGNFDITNVVNVAGRNISGDGIALDGHLADVVIHRVINDIGSGVVDLWSASKLTAELALKADKVLVPTVGNFVSLDAFGNLLDSGSATGTFATAIHTHVAADITDFAAEVTAELNLNSITELSDVDTTTVTPVNGDVLSFDSGEWVPVVLVEADISDLQSYELAFVKGTAFNKNFGILASDTCEGNDARLSDARTPTAHTHVEADITDLQSYLLDITGESISTLSDVLTTMTPVDGEVLTFDTVNGWQSEALPAAPVTSVAGKTGIVTLVEADITDLGTTVATVATPTFTGTVGFPSYVKASLPAQATGHMIYVSDATGASLVGSMCFSNGTVWIDVTTGAAVV